MEVVLHRDRLKMNDVIAELEAVGLPLVDTLLPTHDGCLHSMNQNSTGKKPEKDNLQDGVKKKNQRIC